MTRYTVSDIKAANKAAGQFFFERSAMRFFDSRIERGGPYCGPAGVFFVTSEQFHGSQGSAPRKYTVRQFDPTTGSVDTPGKFNDILYLGDARDEARKAARGILMECSAAIG